MKSRPLVLFVAALMVGSLLLTAQVGPAEAASTAVDAGSTTTFAVPDDIRHLYRSPSNCAPMCEIDPNPGDKFYAWGMQLVAGVPVAFSATKLARGSLYKSFKYVGGGPVWARVTGDASWAGELDYIVDAWGAEAGVEITAKIVDLRDGVWDSGDPVVAQQVVHSLVCSDSVIGLPATCLESDFGEAKVDVRFPLQPGHTYELQYEASVWGKVSGFGVAVASNFYGNFVTPHPYPGVYVENVVLTVDRDLQGQIDELNEKVEELNAQVTDLTTQYNDLATSVDGLRAEFEAHHHSYLTGPGTGQNNTQADTSLPAAPGAVSTAPLDPKLVPAPKP